MYNTSATLLKSITKVYFRIKDFSRINVEVFVFLLLLLIGEKVNDARKSINTARKKY